jgi:hypothetical protein
MNGDDMIALVISAVAAMIGIVALFYSPDSTDSAVVEIDAQFDSQTARLDVSVNAVKPEVDAAREQTKATNAWYRKILAADGAVPHEDLQKAESLLKGPESEAVLEHMKKQLEALEPGLRHKLGSQIAESKSAFPELWKMVQKLEVMDVTAAGLWIPATWNPFCVMEGCDGLQNFGNSCWLIASLQALRDVHSASSMQRRTILVAECIRVLGKQVELLMTSPLATLSETDTNNVKATLGNPGNRQQDPNDVVFAKLNVPEVWPLLQLDEISPDQTLASALEAEDPGGGPGVHVRPFVFTQLTSRKSSDLCKLDFQFVVQDVPHSVLGAILYTPYDEAGTTGHYRYVRRGQSKWTVFDDSRVEERTAAWLCSEVERGEIQFTTIVVGPVCRD